MTQDPERCAYCRKAVFFGTPHVCPNSSPPVPTVPKSSVFIPMLTREEWAFAKCQECHWYDDIDDELSPYKLRMAGERHVEETGHTVDYVHCLHHKQARIEPNYGNKSQTD